VKLEYEYVPEVRLILNSAAMHLKLRIVIHKLWCVDVGVQTRRVTQTTFGRRR